MNRRLLGHGSPDRAPSLTEGLPFGEKETFGQAQGRGQETSPQRGK
jgi:hypothetical protein